MDLGASCFVQSLKLDAFLSHFSLFSFITCRGGSCRRAGSWPVWRASSDELGGGGGGGPLAGAAFIPPSRINHQSLQAANQEKRQSAKRGSGTNPDLFSLQGFFSQIKASHHHFSSLLFLNRSLPPPSVEVEMRVIIENLKDSCYTD